MRDADPIIDNGWISIVIVYESDVEDVEDTT